MKFKPVLSTLLFIFSLSSYSQNWTGNVSQDWNNPANWSGWPLQGNDIVVDPVNYTGAGASPLISSNSVFSPAGMIVRNGATLTISAGLTTTKRIELLNNGTVVNITSGSVNASGSGSQGRFIVSDGAAVIQTGGTVKAAQRLIVELGASYTLHNGLVNPAQELAIGEGNALGSSLFSMSGGTVSMSLGIGFENEAGLYYPTFNMSAGVLTLGGDISWLGVAPGSGTPRFIMSGGIATIGGSILNDPATTVDLYVQLSGTANFSMNGPAITLINPTDSIKQSGNAVFTINNTTTWNNPGVLSADGGTCVINGNTSLQGTGTYTFGSLAVNAGKTLNHIFPADIFITKDLLNNGIFTANLNTVHFSGATAQQIGGNSFTTFHNLSLDNSSAAGLNLNKAVTVNGALQLNSGKLNSSQANLIILADNATASSGSAGSFVNGPLKKLGDDAFVFPLGKNNSWRRLAMTAPASAASEFVAEYFSGSYPQLTPVNMPLQGVSNIEYWRLDRFNSTDVVQPSFYWEDALASAITTCTQISLAHWNGSAWNPVPSGATGSCTGNGAGLLQANAALANLGAFTFGFTGIVNPQTITVCNGDSVVVGTNTYTSSGVYVDVLTAASLADSTVITRLNVLPAIVNSQSVSLCHGGSFSVGTKIYTLTGNYSDTLVSAFGCDSTIHTFLTIKNPLNTSVLQTEEVLSAANTNASQYQWVDCANNYAVLSGETAQSFTAITNGSYALVITEQSCVDTSECFSVLTVGLSKRAPGRKVQVYPNPGSGQVSIETGSPEPVHIRLTDLAGRQLCSWNCYGPECHIDYSAQQSGLYFLEVIYGTHSEKIRLVKLN